MSGGTRAALIQAAIDLQEHELTAPNWGEPIPPLDPEVRHDHPGSDGTVQA